MGAILLILLRLIWSLKMYLEPGSSYAQLGPISVLDELIGGDGDLVSSSVLISDRNFCLIAVNSREQAIVESCRLHMAECRSLGFPVHHASTAAVLAHRDANSRRIALRIHSLGAIARHSDMHSEEEIQFDDLTLLRARLRKSKKNTSVCFVDAASQTDCSFSPHHMVIS